MTNKCIISLTLAVLFLFPQMASADLIMPGDKFISWCYEVSNVNDYPDYIFLYNEERVEGHGIISQNNCFSFYKNGLASIYAIKKIEFNASELTQEFFSGNNQKLIKSNLRLSAFGSVKDNDPLQDAVITLDIISLTESGLNIKKSKVSYTYSDGTSEEKVFQTQDIPRPSKTALLPWWFARFWYIILPTGALLLMGMILVVRRLKK